MEELIGSLMIHELNIHRKKEEEDSKKKKIITIKSSIKFKERNESEDEDKEESEDENEDLGLLTRRFKKFLMKKGLKKRKDDKEKERTNIT